MFNFTFHPYLATEAPPSGGAPAAGSEGANETEQDLADLDAPTPEGDTDDEDAEVADDEEKIASDEEGDDDSSDESGDDSESEDEESDTDEEDSEREAKGKSEPEEKGPVTIKAIKAKYPNLFKDFPQLKAAFFTAPKFLEVFADPESAKEA